MKIHSLLLLALTVIMTSTGCNAQNTQQEMTTTDTTNTTAASHDATVEFKTTEGDIVLRLYGDTPKHRDNFLKLVKDGYYDGLLFHRVIKDFMVQTGDPDSRNAAKGTMLGTGDPGYTIEAEIVSPKYFNKRGALAAPAPATRSTPNAARAEASFTSSQAANSTSSNSSRWSTSSSSRVCSRYSKGWSSSTATPSCRYAAPRTRPDCRSYRTSS